jgi:hypothetical protein
MLLRLLRFLTPAVYLLDSAYTRLHYYFHKRSYEQIKKVYGEKKCSGKVLVFLIVGFRLDKVPFLSMVKYFNNHGYQIVFLINGNFKTDYLKSITSLVDCGLVHSVYSRGNYGYDFGSYKYIIKEIYNNAIDEISLLNDSVYFPACNPGRFFDWLNGSRSFGGSVINYGDKYPHIQSFFMQFKGVSGLGFLNIFFDSYLPLNSRVHAINKGEIGLTKLASKMSIDSGVFFDVDALENINPIDTSITRASLASHLVNTNVTHSLSSTLIHSGYPFLKWDIFKKRINVEIVLAQKINAIPTSEDKAKFITFLKFNLLNKPTGLVYKLLSIYGLR